MRPFVIRLNLSLFTSWIMFVDGVVCLATVIASKALVRLAATTPAIIPARQLIGISRYLKVSPSNVLLK